MERTALYRHWDEEGNLLYIGISLSAVARLSEHKASSRWASDIAKVTVEYFNTRAQAEEAERNAIKTEAPAFNVTHNGPTSPRVRTGSPGDYPGRVHRRRRQIPTELADEFVMNAVAQDGVDGVEWEDIVSRSHGALFGRRPIYYMTNHDIADALRRSVANGNTVEDAGAYYPARIGNYVHIKTETPVGQEAA